MALSSSEIDALWDFRDPAGSRVRFEDALSVHPESTEEITTQIARSYGLERRFEEGWAALEQVRGETPTLVVRKSLEAGRLTNSAGNPERARPHFEHAFEVAESEGLDFYAVDAAHMLGIVNTGQASLAWNERALRMAKSSNDTRAQKWQGSLLNNLGWTYHDQGRYDDALRMFEDALAFRLAGEDAEAIRIARWSVARSLRSLGRLDEALAIQRELEKGPEDGFVSEELGELLLAKGDAEAARAYFRAAFDLLSNDPWLAESEPARLQRLRELGSGA